MLVPVDDACGRQHGGTDDLQITRGPRDIFVAIVVENATREERTDDMMSRKKLAAGLGGLTLLLGTLGGGIAISAAGPNTNTPVIEKANKGPDTDNVQSGSGSQVQDGKPDTGTGTEAKGGPDTDNVQSGSGSQVQDGTPDVPGAVSP